MIEWPPTPHMQALVKELGFQWFGHHGRFAVAYKRRGPIVLIEHFVVHPRLRDFRYVRIAFNDGVEFFRALGVRYVVAFAVRMAPVWRRLGMQESEPGVLRLVI